jgi:chaperonin GroES
MKLKVIDDRVLVQTEEKGDEKSPGGIIIPDTAKEKPQIGKVVAVGTDEDLQKVIKEGDKIVFGKYSGDELEYDGTKYLVVQRSDILAILA